MQTEALEAGGTDNNIHHNKANDNVLDGIRLHAGADNNNVQKNKANDNWDNGIDNLGAGNTCKKIRLNVMETPIL